MIIRFLQLTFQPSAFLSCSHRYLSSYSFCSSETILSDNVEFDEFDSNISSKTIPSVVEKGLMDINTYKVLLQEQEILRMRGKQVPSSLTEDHWLELSECKTYNSRLKLYKFLHLGQVKKQIDRNVKKMFRETQLNKIPLADLIGQDFSTNQLAPYALGFNSIFHRIYKDQMMRLQEYRMAMAQLLGPHVVIDCSYENVMFSKELHHCYTQLNDCWQINRKAANPFNLIFCNVSQDSQVFDKLKKKVEGVNDSTKFFNYTEKHCLNFFPAEELVYLSPHSNTVLENYDGRYVYIIGAFVDETKCEPVSIQKAEISGIKTARFPLERYINLCRGTTLLPMNQCFRILHDLKNGSSWDKALKHIALRKCVFSPFNFESETKHDLLSNKHLYSHYERQKFKEKQEERRIEKLRQKREETAKQENILLSKADHFDD